MAIGLIFAIAGFGLLKNGYMAPALVTGLAACTLLAAVYAGRVAPLTADWIGANVSPADARPGSGGGDVSAQAAGPVAAGGGAARGAGVERGGFVAGRGRGRRLAIEHTTRRLPLMLKGGAARASSAERAVQGTSNN